MKNLFKKIFKKNKTNKDHCKKCKSINLEWEDNGIQDDSYYYEYDLINSFVVVYP